MDAKYVGLLSKVKDREIQAVLFELVKDLEELKAQPLPVPRLEVVGRFRQSLPPPIRNVNHYIWCKMTKKRAIIRKIW